MLLFKKSIPDSKGDEERLHGRGQRFADADTAIIGPLNDDSGIAAIDQLQCYRSARQEPLHQIPAFSSVGANIFCGLGATSVTPFYFVLLTGRAFFFAFRIVLGACGIVAICPESSSMGPNIVANSCFGRALGIGVAGSFRALAFDALLRFKAGAAFNCFSLAATSASWTSSGTRSIGLPLQAFEMQALKFFKSIPISENFSTALGLRTLSDKKHSIK
jgi:hypothetical protein